MKIKIREWFYRYSIPLLLATLSSIVSASIIKSITGNNILAGVGATWIDNITFYGYVYLKDVKRKNFTLTNFIKQIRNMIIEFGPAEYLDTFLVRPFFLSVVPYFINNYQLAILLGSLLAEITYFIPVITFYELRKKVFRD